MIHLRLKKLFDLLAKRRPILPQSLLGKAVRYALNPWPNLTVYLGDGRVDGHLERLARQPAVHQLCSVDAAGAAGRRDLRQLP